MGNATHSGSTVKTSAASSILFCLTLLSTLPGLHGAGRVWVHEGGVPGINISAIAVDPLNGQTIYAATYGAGIYKSTDGGSSWKKPSPDTPGAGSVIVDPVSTQTVYAGATDGMVYKSTDGGGHWMGVTVGSNAYAEVLAFDPAGSETIYAGTRYHGVYKSTDAGTSWIAFNAGMESASVSSLAMDPATPQTVYAASYGSGIFKSTDGGLQWNLVSEIIGYDYGAWSLRIDPLDPQVMYAGTPYGIYRSTDGGSHWSESGHERRHPRPGRL